MKVLDRDDILSFRNIKKSIEDFLGFTNGSLNTDRNNKSQKSKTSIKKTPRKRKKSDTPEVFKIQKLSAIQIDLKKSATSNHKRLKSDFNDNKSQSGLQRQTTPNFQMKLVKIDSDDHRSKVDTQKSSVFDRLCSPNKTKVSQTNPTYLLDRKFELLRERIGELRDKPQITQPNIQTIKLMQYKRKSPMKKLLDMNDKKKKQFEFMNKL